MVAVEGRVSTRLRIAVGIVWEVARHKRGSLQRTFRVWFRISAYAFDKSNDQSTRMSGNWLQPPFRFNRMS